MSPAVTDATTRSVLGTPRIALIAAVVAAAVLTAALYLAGAPDVAVFLLGAVALAGLAWIVSFATESIGERFGPATTGVLQSTLGNLPELFVVLFALSAGEVVVAQATILGSLFANALLVLGMTLAVGARRAPDGVMRFGSRLPNDTATLLLLASFIIVILGVSDRIGDRASLHATAISVVGAVVLLLVYAAWLVAYLRRRRRSRPEASEEIRPQLGFAPGDRPAGRGRGGRGLRVGLLRRHRSTGPPRSSACRAPSSGSSSWRSRATRWRTSWASCWPRRASPSWPCRS